MTRTEIIQILKNSQLSPNKRLGQNFLCDQNITEKIIRTANITQTDNVLEIGPGLGELTGAILSTGCSLTSVEIDAGLYAFLSDAYKDRPLFTLIHADFLKNEIPGSFNKITANLPYYCASEILFRCSELYAPDIICVMLQKEMAERITAVPGTPEYGAMTVMLSIAYQSTIAFHVPSSSFHPVPDVTSSVLIMNRLPTHNMNPYHEKILSLIVKSAFWGRRKTLVKSCSSSPHLKIERALLLDALSILGLNDAVRGETLSPQHFIELSRIIAEKTERT